MGAMRQPLKKGMKKLLFLVTVASVFFIGCQKEEETKKDSLVGGYYSGFAYTGGGFYFMGVWIDSYDVFWSYRFIDEKNAERTANEKNPYGKIISTEQYTYTYNYPNITLIDSKGDKRDGTFIEKNVFRIGSINYQKQ
jgi:hypothetical protein